MDLEAPVGEIDDPVLADAGSRIQAALAAREPERGVCNLDDQQRRYGWWSR